MADLLERPTANDRQTQSVTTILAVANLVVLVLCSRWARSIYEGRNDRQGFDFASPTGPFMLTAWGLLVVNAVGLSIWHRSRPVGRGLLYGAAIGAAVFLAMTAVQLGSMSS